MVRTLRINSAPKHANRWPMNDHTWNTHRMHRQCSTFASVICWSVVQDCLLLSGNKHCSVHNEVLLLFHIFSVLLFHLSLCFWVCLIVRDESREARTVRNQNASTYPTRLDALPQKIKILGDGILRNTFRCAEILAMRSKYYSVKYKIRANSRLN